MRNIEKSSPAAGWFQDGSLPAVPARAYRIEAEAQRRDANHRVPGRYISESDNSIRDNVKSEAGRTEALLWRSPLCSGHEIGEPKRGGVRVSMSSGRRHDGTPTRTGYRFTRPGVGTLRAVCGDDGLGPRSAPASARLEWQAVSKDGTSFASFCLADVWPPQPQLCSMIAISSGAHSR